jgi:hypothetical protein
MLIGVIIIIISIFLLFLYAPLTSLSASQISEKYNSNLGTYAYPEGTIERISGTIQTLKYMPLFNLTLITLNGGPGSWILVFGDITNKLKVGNDIICVATLIALEISLRVYLDSITNSGLNYSWFSSTHNIIFASSYDIFLSIFIVVGLVIAIFGFIRKKTGQ